ncbi:AtpZ/AtpI family protein [Pontimicrobium sp. MEBiC06410]
MAQKPKKQPSPYLRFTTVAFQMGATIYLGNLLGSWLDEKYNLEIWEKIITLFAVFAAMYLVISQVLKISKDND